MAFSRLNFTARTNGKNSEERPMAGGAGFALCIVVLVAWLALLRLRMSAEHIQQSSCHPTLPLCNPRRLVGFMHDDTNDNNDIMVRETLFNVW